MTLPKFISDLIGLGLPLAHVHDQDLHDLRNQAAVALAANRFVGRSKLQQLDDLTQRSRDDETPDHATRDATRMRGALDEAMERMRR
jgi:hypothetical protein